MADVFIPNDLNKPTPSEVNNIPKPSQDWKATNLRFGYNMGHVYGTYEVDFRTFLAWARGPKDTGCFEPTSHIKIYATKNDPTKKVVSINLRIANTDRVVKLFEPVSSHFIGNLQRQLTDVEQSLTNLLEPEQIPLVVRLPFSASGPIEDSMYNGKRQTELKAIDYSIDIKSDSDFVFPSTVFSNIRFLFSQKQLQAQN
jgi:hypothetical protein